MKNIAESLYCNFRNFGQSIALEIGDDTFAYKEIFELASKIRGQIHELKEDNIGIYLTDDKYMYASILAIWWECKTYVPIHQHFPDNKNKSIIFQAEVKHILSSEVLTNDLNTSIIYTNKLDDNSVIIETSIECNDKINAYILFTSGSTGEPKGVPITYSNLAYFTLAFNDQFGEIKSNDTVLQMFELTFDLSVMGYLMTWLGGGKLIGLHKKDSKNFQILDLLEENKLTVALMVPSMMNTLLPFLDGEIINKSLRLNLFCGEALLASNVKKWKKFIPQADIYNVYGPTENTIFCTYYKIQETIKNRNDIVCIGKALKYNQLSFNNPQENSGELLLSGKMLTKGYWKDPLKTSDNFIKSKETIFYKTGDWCEKDEDGDFYFINRIDFQAKLNGYRIELSEIEYFANQILPNSGAVALVNNKNGIDELVIVILDNDISKEKIIAHLKENLPEYSVPSHILLIDEFPYNTSGKLDRKTLRKWISTQS